MPANVGRNVTKVAIAKVFTTTEHTDFVVADERECVRPTYFVLVVAVVVCLFVCLYK